MRLTKPWKTGCGSRVTNDRHGCLKSACPNRSECPFYGRATSFDQVDIVVSNHDLLLADVHRWAAG